MLPINTLGEDYTLKDIAELSDKRLIKAYQSALNEKKHEEKDAENKNYIATELLRSTNKYIHALETEISKRDINLSDKDAIDKLLGKKEDDDNDDENEEEEGVSTMNRDTDENASTFAGLLPNPGLNGLPNGGRGELDETTLLDMLDNDNDDIAHGRLTGDNEDKLYGEPDRFLYNMAVDNSIDDSSELPGKIRSLIIRSCAYKDKLEELIRDNASREEITDVKRKLVTIQKRINDFKKANDKMCDKIKKVQKRSASYIFNHSIKESVEAIQEFRKSVTPRVKYTLGEANKLIKEDADHIRDTENHYPEALKEYRKLMIKFKSLDDDIIFAPVSEKLLEDAVEVVNDLIDDVKKVPEDYIASDMATIRIIIRGIGTIVHSLVAIDILTELDFQDELPHGITPDIIIPYLIGYVKTLKRVIHVATSVELNDEKYKTMLIAKKSMDAGSDVPMDGPATHAIFDNSFEAQEDANIGTNIGRRIPLSNAVIDRFKDTNPRVRSLRINDHTKGFAYLDPDDKLIGVVNTEKKPDDTIWIQGLEVFGDNKGKGFGKALLKVATDELNATRLSVRKSNEIANKMYNDYGFKTYKSDDYMHYMSYEASMGTKLHLAAMETVLFEDDVDYLEQLQTEVGYEKAIDIEHTDEYEALLESLDILEMATNSINPDFYEESMSELKSSVENSLKLLKDWTKDNLQKFTKYMHESRVKFIINAASKKYEKNNNIRVKIRNPKLYKEGTKKLERAMNDVIITSKKYADSNPIDDKYKETDYKGAKKEVVKDDIKHAITRPIDSLKTHNGKIFSGFYDDKNNAEFYIKVTVPEAIDALRFYDDESKKNNKAAEDMYSRITNTSYPVDSAALHGVVKEFMNREKYLNKARKEIISGLAGVSARPQKHKAKMTVSVSRESYTDNMNKLLSAVMESDNKEEKSALKPDIIRGEIENINEEIHKLEAKITDPETPSEKRDRYKMSVKNKREKLREKEQKLKEAEKYAELQEKHKEKERQAEEEKKKKEAEKEDPKTKEERDIEEAAIMYESYFMEKRQLEDSFKDVVDTFNNKGYKVKYASPGHPGLRKKVDKPADDSLEKHDGVYYDHLYSDARIMFKDKYKFPDPPKYWHWREVDGCSYLDISPIRYDKEKDGDVKTAIRNWKQDYMRSIRKYVKEIEPNGGKDEAKEKEESFLDTMSIDDMISEAAFDYNIDEDSLIEESPSEAKERLIDEFDSILSD